MNTPTPIPSHLFNPTTPDAGEGREEPGNWRPAGEAASDVIERLQRAREEQGLARFEIPEGDYGV